MKKNTPVKTSFDRATCDCGNLVEKLGNSKDGRILWGKQCRTCRGRYHYGIRKDSSCNECGFVGKVLAQLQIDHVDGNNKNNDPSNLRTLCCNCHAYKSYVNKDLRFPAESNPFYGKRHSKEALSKIKEAKQRQDGKLHGL